MVFYFSLHTSSIRTRRASYFIETVLLVSSDYILSFFHYLTFASTKGIDLSCHATVVTSTKDSSNRFPFLDYHDLHLNQISQQPTEGSLRFVSLKNKDLTDSLLSLLPSNFLRPITKNCWNGEVSLIHSYSLPPLSVSNHWPVNNLLSGPASSENPLPFISN